jgi:hypothetical protein
MAGRHFKLVCLLSLQLPCAAALPIGCNEAPAKPVALDTAGIEPAVDYADLAAVLDKVFVARRSARRHGLIDADAAAGLAEHLDRQLKRLAVTGPSATPGLLPTDEARLAYWYNARAAWAIKLAMVAKFPRALKAEEFYTRPFPLDGRLMTLKDIDTVLASDRDWRTLISAPCVTLQRARLPDEPLGPGNIRQQIARGLADLIDDDKRFIISAPRKEMLIPPVLWSLEEKLRKSHDATWNTQGSTLTTALLPYISGSAHRRLQDAIGYRCVPAPAACELALEKH